MVIVEISGGEFASHGESAKLVEGQDIRHGVLWDEGNHNHKNYGITSWPAAFLIGADGTVFWQGNPARILGRRDETENMRGLLDKQLKAASQEE